MTLTDRVFVDKKPIPYRFCIAQVKVHLVLCSIFIFGLLPQTAAAEDRVFALTLSEAIQRTFNNHPDLQSFEYQLDAQQGRMIQAGLSPKPEVELTIEDAIGTGDFSGLQSTQSTLSVSWILDRKIKEKRTALVAQGMTLIQSERAIKQLDSATQTAGYFLTALAYQESAIIAKRAIALAETTVEEISKRVEIGKTPNAELYRAEAELAKRKLVLVDLKHQLTSSLYQLAAQWGSIEPTFNSVSGSLAMQPQIISFQTLKLKISQNPDLLKYLSLDRVKQSELRLAQEQNNPKWTFSTGIRRFERSNDFGLVARISVPFGGSNNNQGQIAEMRANIARNQSEAAALRIRAQTSLFVIYQELQHNIHLGEMLNIEVIPRLEKALTETHKAYELGKYSYLEWLAVQNDLLDAQSSLLEAYRAAHLNKIELERLSGAQISSPF